MFRVLEAKPGVTQCELAQRIAQWDELRLGSVGQGRLGQGLKLSVQLTRSRFLVCVHLRWCC